MTVGPFDPASYGRRSAFLPFSPPDITDAEIQAVVDTLRSGWITTGPRVKQFEQAFADYLGTETALALSSCTAGLHLALLAGGIQPGDEVITTPMTFCSSVHVIEQAGAVPVLADIDPETLNLDPVCAAANCSPRVKAIMPVHYAGHPVDMEAFITLARQRRLLVVEDAAHAFPATYRGRRIGTIGNLAAFSFYATKNLTTGEGGMLVGPHEMIERARVLSLHGISHDAWQRYSAEGSWHYEVVAAGYKYNMTDVQAAIGLVQLARIGSMQQRRREIAARYSSEFAQWEELQVPTERPDVEHAWHLYVLRLHLDRLRIDRLRFIEELKQRNIGASVHFIPIHLHPYYRDKYGWHPEAFPVAYSEYRRMVSLPLHSSLSDEDVTDVINAVLDIVSRYRR